MKNIFYLIAVVVGLMYARIVSATEPMQMSMTLKPDGEVTIFLAGSGKATIDWGDGSASETQTLSTYGKLLQLHAYSHIYLDEIVQTLTIIGENITHLDFGGWELTSLDVSKNSALTHLWCFDNQLTSLDVSKNTKLIYLSCFKNQLTSLDVSKNIALIGLDCSANQLSTDALNDLFETLNNNTISEEKTICILYNPETDGCNQSIAISKGWTVACPMPALLEGTTFSIVEELPLYNGKDVEVVIREYINNNIIYPPDARKNNIEGNVLVQFIINRQGDVINARVRQGVHPLLDAEALRIVNLLPKWMPGTMRGKPVNVLYIIPVVFKLN